MAENPEIQEVLLVARRRLRRRTLRRLSLRLATWTLGLLGGLAILDHLYRFSEWQRWLATGIFLVALLAVYWHDRRRRGHGRRLSDLFIARQLELANPALHNALVTALQTNQPLSPAIRAEAELAQARLGNSTTPNRWRWVLPAEILLLGVYSFTAPQSLWQSSARVLLPWRAIPAPTYVVIVDAAPANGDYLITENPWRITLTAAGYAPASGEVYASRDNSPWQRVELMKSPAKDQFIAELPPISGNWSYRARLGDAFLPQRTVRVLQRPVTLEVRQELQYPDYLKQPDVTLSQRPVQAVVGTRIDFEVQLDRNVEAAKIDWAGDSIALRPVGRLVRSNNPLPVEHSGSWRVYYRLTEADDWIRGDGATITAVPDLLPEATITQPDHDVEVAADSLVEFQYQASDDFSVQSPEVVVRYFGSETSRVIPLPEPVLPDRLSGSWTFLPRDFDAKPGDRFTVAVRIRDGHPAHLPGWSQAIGITVVAPAPPVVDNASLALEQSSTDQSSRPRQIPPANPDEDLEPTERISKNPDRPLTDEELADAKRTNQPVDPDEQPDAIVETDNVASDPDAKPQPLARSATDDQNRDGSDTSPPQPPQSNDPDADAEQQTADQPPGEPGNGEPPTQKTTRNDDEQQQPADNQPAPSDQEQTAANNSGEQSQSNEQPADQQPENAPADQQAAGEQADGQQSEGQSAQNNQEGQQPTNGNQPSNTPGNQPGQQPGQQSATANGAEQDGERPGKAPQAANNDQQAPGNGPKPGASDTPVNSDNGRGAEYAANEIGDGDPAPTSAATDDGGQLADVAEVAAPTNANPADPVTAGDRTDAAPDLATNQAPVQNEPPPPVEAPDQRDDQTPPPQLETFDRMQVDAAGPSGESERNGAAPADSPGFAPPQYNADDVDLIQSFREAANRLLRQKRQ